MNQILKLFLLMWFSFGGGMSLFFTWKYGYKSGVIGGVVSGFLFAGFMSAFAIYQARQFRGRCPLIEGETLLKEGSANHFVGAEGVGGWLYLTSARLHFRPHKFNIQKHELSIALKNMTGLKTSGKFSFILNDLVIETHEGTEKFVVQAARDWVEAIEQATAARPMNPTELTNLAISFRAIQENRWRQNSASSQALISIWQARPLAISNSSPHCPTE